jgi:hypothetical protein
VNPVSLTSLSNKWPCCKQHTLSIVLRKMISGKDGDATSWIMFLFVTSLIISIKDKILPVLTTMSLYIQKKVLSQESKGDSWFQTFTVFRMLYASFWVIPRRLNVICRRFGTLFYLHRQCSETSTHKIKTPGNYPEESTQQVKASYRAGHELTWRKQIVSSTQY